MIRNLIKCFDKNKILIVANGELITSGQLHAIINGYNVNNYHDKNILLSLSNQYNIATAIIALEGFASSVLLLPSDVDINITNLLLEQYDADLILTDRDVLTGIKNDTIPILNYTISNSCKEHSHNNIECPHQKIPTRWIVPTSGTTGTPKLISHTLQTLTRTAKTNYLSGSSYRWGLLYDITRFAGMQVFLNSLLSGSTLILFDSLTSFENRLEALIKYECNALSATPTMWRKLLMLPLFTKLKLRQITLGGEIADQSVLSALRTLFPAARIVHIYASTEAGVGFSVVDGFAGFPKGLLSTPPKGMKLRVDEHGYLLLRPELRDQTYVCNATPLFDDDGFINTGDLVVEEDERYYFCGRANGAINVGGNKVQPEEIEKVIYSFPNVRLVSVHGKKNPITGYIVVADVVVDSECENLEEFKRKLAAYCSTNLPPYKRPALIKIVDDLNINCAGKVLRT